MKFEIRTVTSPVGALRLWALEDCLVGLEFADRDHRIDSLAAALEHDFGVSVSREGHDPAGAATRLEAYFAGDPHALYGQPVRLGGTAFQREVWEALLRIPAGETRSYSEQAVAIGRPAALRAVGTANGANRIALFVPCHRVIAADGTLGGYGGGLARKRWLLRHEGATPAAGQLALVLSGAGEA